MKNRARHLILSFCMFFLIGSLNSVSAATTPEIEEIFNWAENNFPQFFPNHQTTQMIDPWTFRFYPTTGIYAGVKENEVFVLGGSFGSDNPTFVSTVSNLTAQIASSGGNGSTSGCEISDIPTGMVVTQSGNVVNITTNDQCIVISADQSNNFCETPAQSAATGISVLSQTNITSFEAMGLTIDIPGVPDPIESVRDSFSNAHCTINAPTQAENQIVNSDICIDITGQFSSFQGVPGVTINPPVTFAYVGTSTSQVVSDCFATDAATVSDAFSGEIWTRGADGGFVQINF